MGIEYRYVNTFDNSDKIVSQLEGITKTFDNFLQKYNSQTNKMCELMKGLGGTNTSSGGNLRSTLSLLTALNGTYNLTNSILGAFGKAGAVAAKATPWAALAVALAGVSLEIGNLISGMDALGASSDVTIKKGVEYTNTLKELISPYYENITATGYLTEQSNYLNESIEETSTKYNNMVMSAEEYVAYKEKIIERNKEEVESYNNNIRAIEEQGKAYKNYATELNAIVTTPGGVEKFQSRSQFLINQLNEGIPGLNLNIENISDLPNGFSGLLYSSTEYEELKKKQEDASIARANAEARLGEEIIVESKAKDKYLEIKNKVDYNDTISDSANDVTLPNGFGINKFINGLIGKSLEAELVEAENEYNKATTALENTKQIISDSIRLDEELDNFLKTADNAEEAAAKAFLGVADELWTLANAYDQAYEAAYDSLSGQFGLYELVELKSTQTAKSVADAWKSQAEAFSNYGSNLEIMKSLGFSDSVIDKFSGGTAEEMAVLDAIIKDLGVDLTYLNSLDFENLSIEDEEIVSGFLNKFIEMELGANAVNEQLVNTSNSIAAVKTDFFNTADEIVAKMQETVTEMGFADLATSTAETTFGSYIKVIYDMAESAGTAASFFTDAVLSGLGVFSFAKNETYGPPIPNEAIGTTNAPDIFLAGEEGPELVVGMGGSRVFTAGATTDILSRAYGEAITDAETANRVYAPVYSNDNFSKQEIISNKTITLKIEGGDSITVDVNGFKEQFVDLLSANLRPVLTSIIQEEIFEEGDGSYVF